MERPPSTDPGDVDRPAEKGRADRQIIAKFVAADAASEPARFVFDLAHYWKKGGGTVAGQAVTWRPVSK
jgi:hypothetical protein